MLVAVDGHEEAHESRARPLAARGRTPSARDAAVDLIAHAQLRELVDACVEDVDRGGVAIRAAVLREATLEIGGLGGEGAKHELARQGTRASGQRIQDMPPGRVVVEILLRTLYFMYRGPV